MKTMGSALQKVRALLDEDREHQWHDTHLREWINEGAREVARKIECLQATREFTATADTQEYTLPADMLRVYRVEYTPASQEQIYPLEYRDWNTMDEVWWTDQARPGSYRPTHFTMWGFPPTLSLVLYPTPSDAGNVKVFYYRLPVERAIDGSEDQLLIEVPEGYDDLVVEYANYMALRRDADPRWQESKALFDERLNSLAEAAVRWTDQAGIIPTGTGFLNRAIWDENYPG